jgi:hypothetical protein
MMRLSGIWVYLLAILSCLCPAFGQAGAEQNQSVREFYESFFRQVVALKAAADHPIEVPLKILPRLQDVVGLTDGEVDILNGVATDWASKISALAYPRGMIFESRLQQIQFGRILEPLASQLRDIENRHDEMVLDHVRQLKDAIGDLRFQVLEAYLHSPNRSPRDLQPVYDLPTSGIPVPVVRKQ